MDRMEPLILGLPKSDTGTLVQVLSQGVGTWAEVGVDTLVQVLSHVVRLQVQLLSHSVATLRKVFSHADHGEDTLVQVLSHGVGTFVQVLSFGAGTRTLV